MIKKWGLTIALLFPLVVMLGWVSQIVIQRQFGEEVELPISGYDPRDLLSGHYLTYRVEYGNIGSCGNRSFDEAMCLCLEKDSSGKAIGTQLSSCEETSCRLFLKGNCRYGRFEAGIERFYFSESHQKALAVVPPKATIKVKVTSGGTGIVQSLLIDGTPLSEWLKQQPQS